jgi:integrase
MKTTWVKDKSLQGLYRRNCSKADMWYVKARQSGAQPRTVKLGRCDVLTVNGARGRAKEVLAQLSAGINPNEVKRQTAVDNKLAIQREEARGLTLRSALDQYLSLKSYKPKTRHDMEGMIQRNFSDWLDKGLRDITRQDVIDRFGSIKTRVAKRREVVRARRDADGLSTRTFSSEDGQGEAQKAFRYLQAIINSFMGDEVGGEPLLTSNPCKVLKDKRVRVNLQPRQRFLDGLDRSALIDLLTRASHPEYQGELSVDDSDFIYLLLMTGLRLKEARTIEWKNVDFNKEIYRVLATKNNTDHVLPMTDATKSLLSRRFKNAAESPWVFPSPLNPAKPSSMSRAFERVTKELGLDFTAHDLRRTVATVADGLGYDIDKISAVLNHKRKGVTAGYIQNTAASVKATLESIEVAVLRTYELADVSEELTEDVSLADAL